METALKPGWLFLHPQDEAATTLWEGLLPLTRQLKGRVLDAGCGNGDYSLRLQEVPGVTEVVSVDIAPVDTISYGKCFRDNVPGGNYLQADIQNLDGVKSESFDGIMAWHVLEHCKKPGNTLREFARIIRKEGVIFIAMPLASHPNWMAYNNKYKGTLQEHHINWGPEDLEQEAIEAGLSPISPVYIDWMGCQERLFGRMQ